MIPPTLQTGGLRQLVGGPARTEGSACTLRLHTAASWTQGPALPLAALTHLGLGFLICKMEIRTVVISWLLGGRRDSGRH